MKACSNPNQKSIFPYEYDIERYLFTVFLASGRLRLPGLASMKNVFRRSFSQKASNPVSGDSTMILLSVREGITYLIEELEFWVD